MPKNILDLMNVQWILQQLYTGCNCNIYLQLRQQLQLQLQQQQQPLLT